MAYLQHPSHKLLVEFYSARKKELEHQLEYNWINNIGKDISDIIRGRIQVLDEFLNLDKVFDQFEELKKQVEASKGAK